MIFIDFAVSNKDMDSGCVYVRRLLVVCQEIQFLFRTLSFIEKQGLFFSIHFGSILGPNKTVKACITPLKSVELNPPPLRLNLACRQHILTFRESDPRAVDILKAFSCQSFSITLVSNARHVPL